MRPMKLVIQKKRRAPGLTQEQASDELGVSTLAVSKWETGTSCPDSSLLPLLARLLQGAQFSAGAPAENWPEILRWYERLSRSSDTADKRIPQAELFRKQQKAADAAGLLKRILPGVVNDLQMVLYKLVDAALADGQAQAAPAGRMLETCRFPWDLRRSPLYRRIAGDGRAADFPKLLPALSA